jgi:hypothetical protein
MAVLHALPRLSPSVERWSSKLTVSLTEKSGPVWARPRCAARPDWPAASGSSSAPRSGSAWARDNRDLRRADPRDPLVPPSTATTRQSGPSGRDRFPPRPLRTLDQAEAAPESGHRGTSEKWRRHWATFTEVILNILKIVAMLIPGISIPFRGLRERVDHPQIRTGRTKYYQTTTARSVHA